MAGKWESQVSFTAGRDRSGEAEIFLRTKAVESENHGTLPRRVSDD